MHQRGLKFIRQLEHSVGDDEVALRAKFEELETIYTDACDSKFANDVTPNSLLFPVLALKSPNKNILSAVGLERMQQVSSS